MKWLWLVFVAINFSSLTESAKKKKYLPTWDSLDARPLPSWYDEAKIGIFIHWGVFSVPSFGSEWFWFNWRESKNPRYVKYMEDHYKPGFSYQDFAHSFTTEFFDPYEWANIFNSSGAKYVVLTSKHHEGYTLWPSKYSYSWNSMDVGPHRDLIGELRTAILNKTDIKFGLYHSLYEWFNPLYLADKSNNFTTNVFSKNKIIPEVVELIKTYKPEIVWSDGEWEAPDTYWFSRKFLAWLYNESPVKDTVVVNDRWGHETLCKHGGFMTCQDRYNPGVLQPKKWENAMTIDTVSWGYRRNAKLQDYYSVGDLISNLVITVSCGGNLLMNVGPTKDGIIPPIFQDRLKGVGDWLAVNGPAIYKSKPWKICQNDTYLPGIWYTTGIDKETSMPVLYAILLYWPHDGVARFICPEMTESKSTVQMLGVDSRLSWGMSGEVIQVDLPDKAITSNDWAWTLKITHVQNLQIHDNGHKEIQIID